MRAGQLDRRITLKRLETTQDDYGQDIETWHTVATVWAAWEPLKGNRRFAAQQVIETAAGSFVIRYRSGLSALHAVEYNGNRYDIHGEPEEIGRREGLRLHVSRRAE